MATKKQVVTLAEKLNVDVEDDGSSIYLTTRGAFMFEGYRQHCLVTSYSSAYNLSKAEVWREVLLDLESGVAKCNIVPCDYCVEIWKENN